MQPLYVVGFDVSTRDVAQQDGAVHRSAFQQVLDHMAIQINRPGFSGDDLLANAGEETLRGYQPGRPDQHVTWKPVIVDETTSAVRMLIDSPLQSGGWFTCQLTASQVGERVGYRVVLGRRSDELLAPARIDEVKPPRSLVKIAGDRHLLCRNGQDNISPTVATALTAQVSAVREQLASPERHLPVLVISSMRTKSPSAALAQKAARQLVGLAHVVVVSGWLALDAFNNDFQELLLPRDGARLYWPGTAPRSPWWSAADLAGNHELLLRQITRLLAPLSVVARGRDALWDDVNVAHSAAQTDALLLDFASADDDQLQRLRKVLDEEKTIQIELLELNESLEAQVARLEIDKANLEAQLEAARLTTTEPDAERSPQPADPRDFGALWDEWTSASGDALIFTDRAKTSWERCNYPFPDRMREALDILADLAGEWRTLNASVGTSLVSWIGDRTPLAFAPTDEGLRREKLDTFKYQNRTLSRLPHIKLDDSTSPDRVGRIYFAIDKDRLEWIVDHVGLKLYGL